MMLSSSFRIFTIFGFDVKLDPSWFFIATLIVWSLSARYFPAVIEGQSHQTYLALAIVGMLGFFASLVLHELAHSCVARRAGMRMNDITLFIFGGVAETESQPKAAGTEFWIAIVGPAVSLTLALDFWLLSCVTAAAQVSDPIVVLLRQLGAVNLLLAGFNLLPGFPLDGGRVYRAILWYRIGDFLEATRRASDLGSTLAYILIGLGILTLFSGHPIGGLWQVFIGFFLLIASKSAHQRTVITAAFKDQTVETMMTRNPFTAPPDQTLSELVNQIMLRHRVAFVPVVENGVLLGYVDGDIVGRIDRENWASTRIGDVFVTLDDTNAIAPQTRASGVLDRMLQTRQRKFLVADGTHLLGVITLSDLMGYLRVLQDIGAPFA